jgi:adenylate cyclase
LRESRTRSSFADIRIDLCPDGRAKAMTSEAIRVRKLIAGIGVRQIRISCGLVLFFYLLWHFTNHALGNISYETMEAALSYHMRFWRNPAVEALFYTAAIVHWFLGLWALYERRQFRYPLPEITQLVLGLSIPLLIVVHIVGSRLQAPLFERYIDYAHSFVAYWITRPYMHWVQFALLLVAWTHGCIGLYFWLRLKSYFSRAAPYLLAVAVLMPTLALLGLIQGAREAVALYATPAWRAENFPPDSTATPPERALLETIELDAVVAYICVLALIFVARGVRVFGERHRGMIALRYPDGRVVRVPIGTSVLEASLRNRIPHASVCGGKARCSTCRIRIVGDVRNLPAPSAREAFVLERVGMGRDPSVRLACQLRPRSDIAFYQLFPPQMTAAMLRRSVRFRIDEERYLVSMFVDMRRSTSLAEKRLPFDTMFFINRFVAAVAKGVEDAGGQTNQFVGDGVLALFGLACGPEAACRQALDAVGKITANVDQLNTEFAHDLTEPIHFGIGVNGGDVVIGDVGYKEHVVFTALGDAVNVAARLQDMTKELGCEVLISEEVWSRAGAAADAVPAREISIRGRSVPLEVRAAEHAQLVRAVGA